MNKYFLFIWVLAGFQLKTTDTSAQKDTLPDFSVWNVGGTIHISWHNPFKNTIQINIQRSKESNKSFITIHSTPDASAKYYKYTDKTAPNDSCYYRVFILFEASNYQFSKVLRPVKSDQLPDNKEPLINQKKDQPILVVPIPSTKPAETLKKDSIVSKPITTSVKVEKTEKVSNDNKLKTDPIPTNNKPITKEIVDRKDIQLILQKHQNIPRLSFSQNAIIKNNFTAPPIIQTQKSWKPSPYIFTGDDGNILIQLPDASAKKYSVTFLKEEGRTLFKIPAIQKTSVTIDKSSFLKSGWYYFELRENNKVIERNKFLVTKDF